MTKEIREAFEKWFRDDLGSANLDLSLLRVGDEYYDTWTQRLWAAWQACASITAERVRVLDAVIKAVLFADAENYATNLGCTDRAMMADALGFDDPTAAYVSIRDEYAALATLNQEGGQS